MKKETLGQKLKRGASKLAVGVAIATVFLAPVVGAYLYGCDHVDQKAEAASIIYAESRGYCVRHDCEEGGAHNAHPKPVKVAGVSLQ